MFELDIEDTFLYGDMLKEECIQQAPGYFALGGRRLCASSRDSYLVRSKVHAHFYKAMVLIIIYFMRGPPTVNHHFFLILY